MVSIGGEGGGRVRESAADSHMWGDLAKISRGKVEQFGWLVQAVADSQCFYHLA